MTFSIQSQIAYDDEEYYYPIKFLPGVQRMRTNYL